MPGINSIFTFVGSILDRAWKPRPILRPLAPLYLAVTALHRFTMRRSVMKLSERATGSIEALTPLMVVGALRVGGSGKTSVTLELARLATARGLRVAILAYRLGRASHHSDSNLSSMSRFNSDLREVREGDDWRIHSEEACMLRRLSGARVFTTRHRARAWERLGDGDGGGRAFDLILSDDGFQDHRLRGAFRILLMAPGENPGLFDLLPGGPYRETARGRAQADLLLRGPAPAAVSATEPSKADAEAEASAAAEGLTFRRTLEFPPGFDAARSWVVICALGFPEGLLADLAERGVNPKAVFIGRNHAGFSAEALRKFLGPHGDCGILCTRKDLVKLAEHGFLLPRLTVVDQTIGFSRQALDRINVFFDAVEIHARSRDRETRKAHGRGGEIGTLSPMLNVNGKKSELE